MDYTRAPDATQSAAINPLFHCSSIINEGGLTDWPCYWSATTHHGALGGQAAMYLAFGRAGGWLAPRAMAGGPPDPRGPAQRPAAGGEYHFADVHGAGAQRSDPKTGDAAQFPHGRGPQGDVIRILNYVRCVRYAGQAAPRDNEAKP